MISGARKKQATTASECPNTLLTNRAGSTSQNSTEPLWLNMHFTKNYIAPTGKFYTRIVKNLQSTEALGYTYENMPKPDNKKIDPVRTKNISALFNPAETAKPKRFKKSNSEAAKSTAHLNVLIEMEGAAKGVTSMVTTSASVSVPSLTTTVTE